MKTGVEESQITMRDVGALLGSCPVPIMDHKEIVLAHGSGGKLTHQLIQKMVLPQFRNEFLEPLHVANEGKLVAVVPPEAAEPVLAAMRGHPLGREAAIIGEVVDDHPGMVTMKTAVGGSRVVDMLSGEQLPRIC
jgi:hydrogenase maturation factor